MGFLSFLGDAVSFIPGIGTAIGAGLKGVDALTKKKDDKEKKGGFPWEQVGGVVGSIAEGLAGQPGVFSPEEQEAARYKYEKKLMEDRRQMWEDAGMKPKTERYETYKHMSVLDPFMKKAIVGSFGDILGSETLGKYGIDLGQTLSQLGGGMPPRTGPMPAPGAPAGGGGYGPIAISNPAFRQPNAPWYGDQGKLAV